MRSSGSTELPAISKPLALVRELLAHGDEVIVAARGQSMWPTVCDGDEIVIAPLRRAPRPGEIVLIEQEGRALLHRVVRVRGESVQTRGDAAEIPDIMIAAGAVIGVAAARIRSAGRESLGGSFDSGRARLRHLIRPLREALARLAGRR